MKTKFFLTLLALNGLLLGANSVSATTVSTATSAQNITNLSQTIANLIDVTDRGLVEVAINRALLAQGSSDNKKPNPAGGMPIRQPNIDRQPIINGRIANPNTRPQRPIINGIIKNPEVQPVDRPLINGVIVKPEERE